MAKQYKKISDIPDHIFSNKECTTTPSAKLLQYLRYMLDNHPNDLEYLWRYGQGFQPYGGCYILSFDRWKEKLERDLKAQGV